uniref:Uncharacterized protein n=1 Tax=Panagrolaimus sp. JU765 TaxID=591449 RepID=A0AC34PWA1_9BILA
MLSQIGGNSKRRKNSLAPGAETPTKNCNHGTFEFDRLRYLKSDSQLLATKTMAFRSENADEVKDAESAENEHVHSNSNEKIPSSAFANQNPKDHEQPKKMGFIVSNKHEDSPFFRFNVGGQSFFLRFDTLLARQCGLLSYLANLSHNERLPFVDAFFEQTNEYYFERQPMLFNTIYQFYLTGKIHQPAQACPQDILDELDYWGIDPNPYLSPCCCGESEPEEEEEEEQQMIDEFENVKFGSVRKKLWQIIEEPTSSIYGQIFAFLSVLFVLISISGLVLGSIPDLQVPHERISGNNETNKIIEREPHPILVKLEYVCIVWFSFEYFSKMIVSANRWKTFRQLLNIIDLFAILPFMIEMSLAIIGVSTDQLQDLKGAFLVIRILRVLRVIRVLKLGRYSSGLQMFGKTLQASFRQLGMMGMVVMTGVIFFSTLVYFLEKDEPNSGFYSIPASCWWCLVTMSTVGYGDLTPVTVAGKLVATGAIACGVLVLALPITIIVDNFMKVAEAERKPGFTGNAKVKRLGPRARVAVPEVPNKTGSNLNLRKRKISSQTPAKQETTLLI